MATINKNFLDLPGLQIYDGKIKELIPSNPNKLGTGFGTCSTAELTVAKEASLTNYELVTNGIVAIQFDYPIPASATLNINNKGAKPIYYKGVAIIAGIVSSNDIATFIYDGSNYQLISIDKFSGGNISPTVDGTTLKF